MSYSCEYCNKLFSNRHSKSKHQISICKSYKSYKSQKKTSDFILGIFPLTISILKKKIYKMDIYDEMITKYGYDNTINLISMSTLKCDPMLIVKKMYFNNKSTYPIVLRNNHYRYLNLYKEIVDNANGNDIINNIINIVHNTMVRANIEIIKSRIINSNSNTIDYLFDVYDIIKIQSNLSKIFKLKKKLKQDFDKLIQLKNHPYFDSENITIYVI